MRLICFLKTGYPTALSPGPNDALRENGRHQSGRWQSTCRTVYSQRIIDANRSWLKEDQLLITEAKVSNRGYNGEEGDELRITAENSSMISPEYAPGSPSKSEFTAIPPPQSGFQSQNVAGNLLQLNPKIRLIRS